MGCRLAQVMRYRLCTRHDLSSKVLQYVAEYVPSMLLWGILLLYSIVLLSRILLSSTVLLSTMLLSSIFRTNQVMR